MTALMELSSQSKQWKKSATEVTSGMSRLGIEPDTMQRITGALQLFSGMAQAGSVATAVIGVLRTMATAEAVAETSVRVAEGPPGWAVIGAALGASATVGAVIGYYAQQANITINTDSPSELKMAAGMAGGIT